VHRVLSWFVWPVFPGWTGPRVGLYAGDEHAPLADLVHVDSKKLGPIWDGGHRVTGRAAARWNRPARPRTGPRSPLPARLSEILIDEKTDTVAGFWERANAYFASCGIVFRRVLTDNGSCYRSRAFKDVLSPETSHRCTRPYRPHTNGKVEAQEHHAR
jgi:transposase InsO family protein